MGFEIGNETWRIRAKHGRDRTITDHEKLAEDAEKYFQNCIDSPLEVEKTGMNGTTTTLHPMVFQKGELAMYCGVSSWRQINELKEVSNDFLQIVTRIESIIKSQKFRYGMIGVFNSNIVARDLGLTDKKDLTSGGDKLETPKITVNSVELPDKLKGLMDELKTE